MSRPRRGKARRAAVPAKAEFCSILLVGR